MFMHWPGVTSDQYDAVMARLDLDVNPAAGGVLHVAALTEDGLEVCEVWQTELAFHGYLEHRPHSSPSWEALEISGLPQITLVPLHNLYAGPIGRHRPDRRGFPFRGRSRPGLVDVLRRRGLQTAPPGKPDARIVRWASRARRGSRSVRLASPAVRSCFSAFSS